MIKFGCCIPGGSLMPEGIAEVPASAAEQLAVKCRFVLQNGFDFTECTAGMIAGITDEELDWLVAENARDPLGLIAVNSMFLPTYRLADPGETREDILRYVYKLIDAMTRLGIRYAVLGSGVARTIPPEVDRETGLANLRRFMNDFADYGEPRGVTLLIEPLREKETNVYMTVPESDAEIRLLNRPGIQLLADAFHMAETNTQPEAVEPCIPRLLHCHMAEAPDRTCPGSFTTGDPAFNKRFAAALNRSGYTGGVSAECSYTDFYKDVPEILHYMRAIFQTN